MWRGSLEILCIPGHRHREKTGLTEGGYSSPHFRCFDYLIGDCFKANRESMGEFNGIFFLGFEHDIFFIWI